MKSRFFSLKKFSLISILGLFWSFSPLHAGSHDEPVDKFVNVAELKRLLEVAREAGFTEDEIGKITIEREGKVINVLEFLKAWEQKQKDMKARERAYVDTDYLTAQDIFSELNKTQPKDLSKLRDQSRFRE